jgi:NAD(P)-dependent dehydrogenase (short-subunit alcohol dehydrogenase family)
VQLGGKVVVVTGAAGGIGRALALRFAQERPKAIVVADIDGAGAEEVARQVGGLGLRTNVGVEADVQTLVSRAVEAYGQVDVFCSNAGIFVSGGEEVADAEWRRILDVNVMAHIYAARAVVPGMLARGEGYFLSTVSAAGLLSQVGSAPYAVTKHAALAFSEWLSITHGDKGLLVSALCPQGVRTSMLADPHTPSFLLEGSLSAEEVAEATVAGMRDERFLILPHPEVATYFGRKASDYDRWIRGMRRLDARVRQARGE